MRTIHAHCLIHHLSSSMIKLQRNTLSGLNSLSLSLSLQTDRIEGRSLCWCEADFSVAALSGQHLSKASEKLLASEITSTNTHIATAVRATVNTLTYLFNSVAFMLKESKIPITSTT